MRLPAEVALIAIAAVAVAASLALLPRTSRSRRRRAARRHPSRPAQLVALERMMSMAEASALHVHAYLRPVLAEIASQRLAARGQALERMPDPVGRACLGDGLWEIVRPDRPFPADRHGPGIEPHDLEAMLDRLERL
jgi:hypothetical protein